GLCDRAGVSALATVAARRAVGIAVTARAALAAATAFSDRAILRIAVGAGRIGRRVLTVTSVRARLAGRAIHAVGAARTMLLVGEGVAARRCEQEQREKRADRNVPMDSSRHSPDPSLRRMPIQRPAADIIGAALRVVRCRCIMLSQLNAVSSLLL